MRATEFHIDVRYPGLMPEPLDEEDLRELLLQAGSLLDDLESALHS